VRSAASVQLLELDDSRLQGCSQVRFVALDVASGLCAQLLDLRSTLTTASRCCVTDRRRKGRNTICPLSHAPTAMAAQLDVGAGHPHFTEMEPFPNDGLTHLHHHDATLGRSNDHRLTQSLEAELGDCSDCNVVGDGEKLRTTFDLGRVADGL